MSKFKDKCDNCGKWSYDCKGYNGKVLCPECLEKEKTS